MPYTHRKVGDEECVYKKDGGTKVGCTKGSIKKYLAALHANANESITENKTPKIFSYTAYRLPTEDELKEIDSCNLNAEEINKGFGYTIIGKGMADNKNKKMIIDAISKLCSMYPENEEYKKALANAKEMKGRFITESNKPLIKRLIRENIGLFDTHSTNPTSTFHILDHKVRVGTVVIGQINKNFGKDTMEILSIYFNKDVNHLEIGKRTLLAIFEKYPDIQRIVVQPKPESRDFWYKLDGQRINDRFMIIFRAQ